MRLANNGLLRYRFWFVCVRVDARLWDRGWLARGGASDRERSAVAWMLGCRPMRGENGSTESDFKKWDICHGVVKVSMRFGSVWWRLWWYF